MAKLLTLLFEITALFDMRTRVELVMLQKTMVVVEGVARTLDPRLDMWGTAEPVVRSWIEGNLGPAGKVEDAASTVGSMVRGALALPDLLIRAEKILAKIETAVEEGGPLSPSALEERASAESGRLGHLAVALWIVALGVLWKVVVG
jgi:ubiquinone biosynthesis protein